MRLLTIAVFCLCLSATSQTESSRLGSSEYPEFLEVPGGAFSMGDEWMIGYPEEQPVHDVRLRGFKISKTEVTVKQYRTYCNKTGKSMPDFIPQGGWRDNRPMIFVNWRDCMAYCEWLSEVTGDLCRLPTEAEWEYAARGAKPDKGYKYSGSHDINSVAWFSGNNTSRITHPVAEKQPNELGLYDMSGNVSEWCMDWYGFYQHNTTIDNPQGPTSGRYRVLRGGSAFGPSTYCRVAYRVGKKPDQPSFAVGFRVVRE
jgi:sulfatase modifying factor 1